MALKSGLFPGIIFGFLAEQVNNCEKTPIYVHIHSMYAFLPVTRGDGDGAAAYPRLHRPQ